MKDSLSNAHETPGESGLDPDSVTPSPLARLFRVRGESFTKRLRRITKYAFTRLGEQASEEQIHVLNAAVNYLETGRWLRATGLRPPRRYYSRDELFRAVAAPIARRQVVYLEFGVFHGASIRRWAQLLEHSNSALHGFDSFEGLPEKWNVRLGRGSLDVGGQLPQVDDPRVEFHKGWFEDTLSGFSIPDCEQLVLHLDADLYSSTRYVLNTLQPSLVPGTILMFDQFSDRNHELRAFSEFLEETGASFRSLGATMTLAQAAFQRTA